MEIENKKKPNAQTNESLPKAYATTHTYTHTHMSTVSIYYAKMAIVNDAMSYAFRIKQLVTGHRSIGHCEIRKFLFVAHHLNIYDPFCLVTFINK